jgi:hypothetical protein
MDKKSKINLIKKLVGEGNLLQMKLYILEKRGGAKVFYKSVPWDRNISICVTSPQAAESYLNFLNKLLNN